ncbi:MAG: hypothetical protein WD851_18900, partial [Pirellulales bacterium]
NDCQEHTIHQNKSDRALVTAKPRTKSKSPQPPPGDVQTESPADPTSAPQSSKLVNLTDGMDLFHDPSGKAFARYLAGDHWEVRPVKKLKTWLRKLHYDANRSALPQAAMQSEMEAIEAKAIHDGPTRDVFVRIAEHNEKVYLDLANDKWQVVEIDQDGWRVLNESPVMFRREPGMMPLPVPQRGGSVDLLRPFVNISDEHWPLLKGFLVAAFHPRGPYPILAVSGEQGSAKSMLCRYVKSLIDPNSAPLRSLPRNERELAIAANNSWMPVFDNLSSIPNYMADALCRLSTGGGLSTRTNFSDDEETIFSGKRPVVLNGIEDVARRSDLLDRSILLPLPRIENSSRRTEAELDKEFEAARPFILGALLGAVSAAIRNLSSVHFPAPPRMADIAVWITAAEPALGLNDREFINAYNENQDDASAIALESSPVARVLIEFATRYGSWQGTAADLSPLLGAMVDDQTRRSASWLKDPRKLGGDVKRLAPNLRTLGVNIERGARVGKNRTRLITITKSAPAAVEMRVPQFFDGLSVVSANDFDAAADAVYPLQELMYAA